MSRAYLIGGPAAAVAVAVALVPFREGTPASNFTFVFIALTIVVSELGGRGAGLATAMAAALSLDFFLTPPYLRLEIESKHDVVAFLGVAMCGLLAAALAADRQDRIRTLEAGEAGREILRAMLRRWDPATPCGPQLADVLALCTRAFPLAGAAIRNEAGNVLARGGRGELPPAAVALSPETLFSPADATRAAWTLPLPPDGGSIALQAGPHHVGWLDVWGSGAPASAQSRRALGDVARLLAMLMWMRLLTVLMWRERGRDDAADGS